MIILKKKKKKNPKQMKWEVVPNHVCWLSMSYVNWNWWSDKTKSSANKCKRDDLLIIIEERVVQIERFPQIPFFLFFLGGGGEVDTYHLPLRIVTFSNPLEGQVVLVHWSWPPSLNMPEINKTSYITKTGSYIVFLRINQWLYETY